MIIIVEGPDGVGKSTLVNHLADKFALKIKHSSSSTKNDLQYHLDLLEDNVILDRANLGEIIYPKVFNREAKMQIEDQDLFMATCDLLNVTYIIMYASDYDTLKSRLFNRGDSQSVLDTSIEVNKLFKKYAKKWSRKYDCVHKLDITKIDDQCAFVDEILSKEGD